MTKQRHLAASALFCGILGLGGWTFYLGVFGRVFGEGWMVFFNAARLYFDGQLAWLYDGFRFTALLNARFAPWLAGPLPLHPWLYPPHALLLLLPFGWLPFAPAGILFLTVGFVAIVAAAWCFATTGTERAVHAVSLALCPATAVTVCLGQNTFISGALFLAGFGMLRRRPLIGGALLGVLTYKPQLWLMVHVALIAARQWKALTASAVAALLLFAASVALFGLEPWRAWIALMTEPNAVYSQWQAIARLNGQSIFTYASLLGASTGMANLLQALFAVASGACVWWCYRRPMADDLRLAVLLAATMLAAPHIIDYDALLLGIAATLFFVRAYTDGFRVGDVTIAVLLWASPLINPPSVFRVGFATPALILLFIACVILRGRRGRVGATPDAVLNPA